MQIVCDIVNTENDFISFSRLHFLYYDMRYTIYARKGVSRQHDSGAIVEIGENVLFHNVHEYKQLPRH